MVKRPAEIQASEDNIKKAKMATPMNVDSEAGVKIDEDLHSRQLAVYGKESMKRMANASVLIVGVKGLGVEVAKNVILAGVKAVALYDPSPVDIKDLGCQFYLTPDDVGKPTAAACKDSLQELNKAVQVGVLESLPNEVLTNYQVVVCTSCSLKEAQQYNAFCRAQSPPIPFVYAKTAGVFGQIFCDFGPEFVVFDTNGEPPHSGIIAGITPAGANTVVTCVEEERLGFTEGELVTFSEIAGMEPLNSAPPARVRAKTTYSIEIELDTTQFPAYSTGGIVTQYKEPKQMSHRSMDACMADPGDFLLSDFSKIERPQLLHIAFQALEVFAEKQGKLPTPGSKADIAAFMSVFEELNASQPKEQQAEASEAVLAQFASTCSAELNPMAAMFGGIVGQEAVKAISGKFTPMTQWFYFDSVESLPSEVLPEAEYEPAGCRYDHQIAVFGRTLQARLASLRTFLVGAGALGCEFLKNFALMGVACGDAPPAPGVAAAAAATTPGVIVTDDDVIEKSNLSRQFLFRDWDIGGFKAAVAGAAAQRINPALRAQLLQNRVSVDTEDVFNDEFWEGLDVVVNALDNVNARLYVDSRCVYFQRPLLESGTLGTKCNTQMVIPNLTENYGATRDPPEKSAPMCTLHSFPHNIDHCLTWARSEFEGNLESNPKEVNSFLEDPEKYLATAKAAADHTAQANLEAVANCLGASRCQTFEDCIALSRHQFEARFHNKIAQLTYTFPEDAKTSTGALFWSPPKRFPRVVDFDPADPAHRAYLQASAILFAEVYGVERPPWAEDAAEVASKAAAVPVEKFMPRDNVKIETDPNAKADDTSGGGGGHQDVDSRIASLCAQLDGVRQQLPAGFRVSPVLFEKDDDANFHMDLITALANMRARNYGITEVEKLQAKLIAGRIIPAIATATALATGLICLDLYKLLHAAPIEAYRNTFVNLALPLFAASEPLPAKKEAYRDMAWTLWDRWTLEGDLTVKDVLDWFKAKGLEAYSISYGAALLYNNIFPRHKERLGSKLSELLVSVAKITLPAGRRHFDVVIACEDDDGEDIDVPLVSIRYC